MKKYIYNLSSEAKRVRNLMEKGDFSLEGAINLVVVTFKSNIIVGREVIFTNPHYNQVGGCIGKVIKKNPLHCRIDTHSQAFMGEHTLKKSPELFYGTDFLFKTDTPKQKIGIDIDALEALSEKNGNYSDNYRLIKGFIDKGNKNEFFLISVGRDASIQTLKGDELEDNIKWRGISVPTEAILNLTTGKRLEDKDIFVSRNNFLESWGAEETGNELEKALFDKFDAL